MGRKIKYTKEELLEILVQQYNINNKIKQSDFRSKNGLPHYQTYIKEFGSWNDALNLIGLPTKDRADYNISPETLIDKFKNLVIKLGKIPSLSELDKINDFPSHQLIYKHFNDYDTFVNSCGFNYNKINDGKFKKEFLINEIKRFVSEFNKIPTPKDFEKLESYPSRKTFTNHFGNFNNVVIEAGFKPVYISLEMKRERDLKTYTKDFLINEIHRFIKEFNRVPIAKDFDSNINYPSRDKYRKIFGNWSNALLEANLPLNHVFYYTDEFLESEFNRFVKENGRIPIFREFNNSEYPSFWCYQNRFGSWNNAVKAYGYEIQSDVYNFEVLKNKLLEFCYNIKNTENRNIITVSDIENCDELPSYSCYRKHLKNNGYSIRSFLNEYGFDIPKEGRGMNYTFEDGEKTSSQHEFNFSNYLRNNLNLQYNIDYFRDIKYKKFIKGYNKNSNCDYVINLNNKVLYIEIAGILRDYKNFYIQNIIINSKSREDYRINLYNKEKLLKDNCLNYHILFPFDLNEEYLDAIFNDFINIKEVI